MSKLLGTQTGEGFESQIWQESDERIWFVADFDNDADGGSNPDGDPDWQSDTALHFNGKPIDAERVCGIVVPSWLPNRVRDIVLGCKARVTNLRNMRVEDAVVHDLGPLRKNGEGTPELARRLGIDPNAVRGGEDEPAVLFELWPGRPAVVDGVMYNLQLHSSGPK